MVELQIVHTTHKELVWRDVGHRPILAGEVVGTFCCVAGGAPEGAEFATHTTVGVAGVIEFFLVHKAFILLD